MSPGRTLSGVAWVPPVIWMVLIAWFSGERWGPDHTGPTVTSLLQWFVPSLTPAQVKLAHVIARKGAHFAEYAILSFLWFRAFTRGHGFSVRRAAWAALAISSAWAALDEVHQSFVSNRVASPIDVLIDVGGAALALALVSLVRRARHGAPLAAGQPPRLAPCRDEEHSCRGLLSRLFPL